MKKFLNHSMVYVGVIILVIAFASARPSQEKAEPNCGYKSCHETKDGFINVHLVPHTHDDVGWLKTVDQYYFGSRTNIQSAGVQYILDSVVDSLRKDSNRRFIYVETSFFWKWWIKQHDVVKSLVRKFVNNGQLEFISGGWTMNDEATTNYQSIIDQFTWGLRKLNETFGECGRPKVGWQIDPFGHSREMASIFAQLGFDGVLLGRIDYQDKEFRFKSKSPEMIWQGSPKNLGKRAEIFTSVMYNTYAPPPGFCFDILCDDEPIIDDKKSADYNVDKRINQFLDYVRNATKVYTTNNVIITMGNDFNYQDANVWFKNMDKLIQYANAKSNETKINLLYSTPSCYLKAIGEDAQRNKITFNSKEDDFFPYASDPNAYWTGYFSSRPTIKRFERLGNNFLQVCKQLYALTDLNPEDWADLNVLREAMGVMQHHDAITGTEKQHVAQDYARQLTKGFDECDFVAATALSKIATGGKTKIHEDFQEPKPEIPFQSCLLANISQCELTENSDQFVVTIYNPLSRNVNQVIKLPVTHTGYDVKDIDGKSLETVLIPVHKTVLKMPGRNSTAKFDLIFEAIDLPPLGYKSFYITKTKDVKVVKPTNQFKSFQSGEVKIKVDQTTGLIFEVSMNGKDIPLSQNFYFYKGAVGDNFSYKNRSSGAYIFRPNGTVAHKIAEKVLEFNLYETPIVTELHQTFNEWASQIIRIYNKENLIEFDWIIGSIPTDEIYGKEVVTKYTTQLKSESTFYTDSNGREMLKRVRSFRPTWKVDLHEPISGNYYPVTSKILMRDPNTDTEMAVLVDRAQGGSSIQDGEIELMVHRRCLHDDAFGVDEALNETAYGKGLVARGSHYLILGPYIQKDGLAAYERDVAQRKLLQAWTFVSPTMNLPFDQYKAKYLMQYSGLNHSLPKNVQILTLEPWKSKDFLLRLEHILENDEDSTLSKPVTINLKNLFVPFKITAFHETTLGANQWVKDNVRLVFPKSPISREDFIDYFTSYAHYSPKIEENWSVGNKFYTTNQEESNDINSNPRKMAKVLDMQVIDEFDIVLNPMQIRTFVIEILH